MKRTKKEIEAKRKEQSERREMFESLEEKLKRMAEKNAGVPAK